MNDKEALLRRIHSLDFALWELHIFLDTHPANQQALQKFAELTEKRITLAEEFEEKFGPMEHPAPPEERWKWVQSPWPWEPDFEEGGN